LIQRQHFTTCVPFGSVTETDDALVERGNLTWPIHNVWF